MNFDILQSPLDFLQQEMGDVVHEETLRSYEIFWQQEGRVISQSVDRAGTPWLRMFDSQGERVDEVLLPQEYWTMLHKGYEAGAVWRVFEENSLLSSYLQGYVTSFYDSGLYCPHTVSLASAVVIEKYGSESLQQCFLSQLLKKDETVFQAATWMTEVKGGSDLGANTDTLATSCKDRWSLNGDKYFCSNVQAEMAVVAARIESSQKNVRGLALFLVPKFRQDGNLNYQIRRLKNKIATRSVVTGEVELRNTEAYLLGQTDNGIYLIMEVLNISRVANSVASMALAQRALFEAWNFARQRSAFSKPIIEHGLMQQQFIDRFKQLQNGFALSLEAAKLLDEVWLEKAPYSQRYHLFRLMAHLSKYWCAEFAVQTTKWAMEVCGGVGVLEEYGVERWLREAMILQIWEGTPHRQILDGLGVMERKGAHLLLFDYLQDRTSKTTLKTMSARVEAHLKLPKTEKEAKSEALFSDLALFTMNALTSKS
ncbi:MAG: acyl-CoA dehydrogenase family protein [Gammaproteobacteria bacterium]|nr:acyl-CoA dehydrogenase family protein [Gammaproteobacteria bacterium]